MFGLMAMGRVWHTAARWVYPEDSSRGLTYLHASGSYLSRDLNATPKKDSQPCGLAGLIHFQVREGMRQRDRVDPSLTTADFLPRLV